MPRWDGWPLGFSRVLALLMLGPIAVLATGTVARDHGKQETRASVDFDHLLRSNLERVLNESDDAERAQAISELFKKDVVMYEPGQPVEGRAAISMVATGLLQHFGPAFRFKPEGVGVGHREMGTLRWTAGNINGPVVVQRFDTA